MQCAAKACIATWLAAACGLAYGDKTEVYVALAAVDFGYKEYSESGALLDREDGALPGIVLEATRKMRDWEITGGWRSVWGTADYGGRTNLGMPVSTETGERIQSVSLRLARRLEIGAASFAPYIGFGFHEWQRDIRSTRTANNAPVSGLFETYAWKTAELGIKAHVVRWGPLEGGFDARVFRVHQPSVKVRFPTQFDETRLALGEKSGARLSILCSYPLAPPVGLRFELFHERWSFGRSAPQPLTSGGVVVGSVVEPRSETRNTGVALGVVRSF